MTGIYIRDIRNTQRHRGGKAVKRGREGSDAAHKPAITGATGS